MRGAERELALAELATKQYGLVSSAQLRELGVPRSTVARRIEGGRWWRVRPNVIQVGPVAPSFRARLMEAVLAIPGSAASHIAAGHLWDVRYLGPRVVELTAPPNAAHVLDGTVHRYQDLGAPWVVERHGIPTTTPERTVLDLGAVLGRGRLERVLDGALAAGLVSIPELAAAFDAHLRPGRRGLRRLRPLIVARGDGFIAPQSQLEAAFLAFVRSRGLPEPVRQHPLAGSVGRIGTVDFAYPEVRVLVELDGRLGHSQVVDFEADRRRDQEAVAIGWRVIRITWRQLHREPDRIERVLRAVLQPTSG